MIEVYIFERLHEPICRNFGRYEASICVSWNAAVIRSPVQKLTTVAHRILVVVASIGMLLLGTSILNLTRWKLVRASRDPWLKFPTLIFYGFPHFPRPATRTCKLWRLTDFTSRWSIRYTHSRSRVLRRDSFKSPSEWFSIPAGRSSKIYRSASMTGK